MKSSAPLRIFISIVFGIPLMAPTVTQAAVFRPYFADSSDVFAMATAGMQVSNDLVLLGSHKDNRVLGEPNQNEFNIGDGTQVASATQAIDSTVAGTAHASATFGQIRLSAATVNGTSDFTPHSAGIADAGWVDTLTISHPLLNGRGANMRVSVATTGTLVAQGPDGLAYVSTEVTSTNFPFPESFFSTTDSLFDPPGVTETVTEDALTKSINANNTFNVIFTFGVPFELQVRALAFSGSRSFAGAGGAASADFENTIRWNGIQHIFTHDASGDTFITGYSVSSVSNFDYSRPFSPVPSPQSFWLLASAIAGFGLWRKGHTIE